MQGYRFQLDKSSKKFECPLCHQEKYVRYIDNSSGNYHAYEFGRCDREINCGYFLSPHNQPRMGKSDVANNKGIRRHLRRTLPISNSSKSELVTNIPFEVLKSTLKASKYESNRFIQYLLEDCPFPFEPKSIEKIISQYYLGTIEDGWMAGAITFPFIDLSKNIRTVQVKSFDNNNHSTRTDFLHTILKKDYQNKKTELPGWLESYLKNEKYVTCLFGEHLLSKFPNNPIALVEAPKSAIYGTLYFGFPDNPTHLLWLAVYNLSSLNLEKCKVLKGRKVFLFPDLSKDGKACRLWAEKANEFSNKMPDTQFIVSNFLEKNALPADKEAGLDIADFLIKLDWRDFRPKPFDYSPIIHKEASNGKSKESEKCEKSDSYNNNFVYQANPWATEFNPWPCSKTEVKENWDEEILQLESFFNTINLSNSSYKLYPFLTIRNLKTWIERQIYVLKQSQSKPVFKPTMIRLRDLHVKMIAEEDEVGIKNKP